MPAPSSPNSERSSPHTRGAPAALLDPARRRRIIPAYAGSTRGTILRLGADRDHPRIRGEHISALISRLDRLGSSPHTRGARLATAGAAGGRGIIPAYAGSTPPRASRTSGTKDHPRIRGEHDCEFHHETGLAGSSPHTRGAPVRGDPARGAKRIIPAYAGSTRLWRPCRRRRGDHPRIRGEHSPSRTKCTLRSGSSPHTRGAPERAGGPPAAQGIIPAYAGSTWRCRWMRLPCWDHPRIRGEHVTVYSFVASANGSSPHTRGAPRGLRRRAPHSRIIPAYAGSTMCPTSPPSPLTDHPRIRGEHRSSASPTILTSGSSPHTRGALRQQRLPRPGGGIIPAYAGSTRGGLTHARTQQDHPRIRGEHI